MRNLERKPIRVICRTANDFAEAVAFMGRCELIATDVETIPHMPRLKKKQPFVMTVCSYSGITADGEMRSYAVQLTRQKTPNMFPPDNFLMVHEAMGLINGNPVPKTLHNGAYDCAWFLRYRVPLNNYAYDSMTLWWSRFPDLPKTLDVVSSVLLDDHQYWKSGRNDDDFMGHTLYAMEDTEVTLRCTLRLLRWAAQDPDMLRNFQDAHSRCLIGFGMSMRGLKVDWDKRQHLSEALEIEKVKSLEKLQWLVGDENLNPNSPGQMSHLFYTLLGAKPRNAKGRELKRVTGNAKPSTGALAMKGMKADNPLIARVVRYVDSAKKPAKQISNVMSIQFPDERFRTSYDGVGTSTTRYSSRRDAFGFGGNAQNIRKEYRAMCQADSDSFILEADFSAADDVFVSYESEDPRKIELVESGMDIHSFNAATVFFTNWTYEQVVAGKKAKDPLVIDPITGIRQITKKTTHGANYLMAGMTLLMSAGREAIVAAAKYLGHHNANNWSTKELGEFCDHLDAAYRKYYVRFARSGSDSFYTDLQTGLIKHHSFTTIFGYRQRFSGDAMDQATLRACAATVGQANTAGRVNMALLELEMGQRQMYFRDGPAPDSDDDEVLPVSEESHGCSLRLQTHDSIGYNVNYRHPHWQQGVERILKVMRRPVLCKGRAVRVGVEADVAFRWAEKTHEIWKAHDIESWLVSHEINI